HDECGGHWAADEGVGNVHGSEPDFGAIAFWSAPVLWRFGFSQPATPPNSKHPPSQSARGLAHSKTWRSIASATPTDPLLSLADMGFSVLDLDLGAGLKPELTAGDHRFSGLQSLSHDHFLRHVLTDFHGSEFHGLIRFDHGNIPALLAELNGLSRHNYQVALHVQSYRHVHELPGPEQF